MYTLTGIDSIDCAETERGSFGPFMVAVPNTESWAKHCHKSQAALPTSLVNSFWIHSYLNIMEDNSQLFHLQHSECTIFPGLNDTFVSSVKLNTEDNPADLIRYVWDVCSVFVSREWDFRSFHSLNPRLNVFWFFRWFVGSWRGLVSTGRNDLRVGTNQGVAIDQMSWKLPVWTLRQHGLTARVIDDKVVLNITRTVKLHPVSTISCIKPLRVNRFDPARSSKITRYRSNCSLAVRWRVVQNGTEYLNLCTHAIYN